MSVLRALLLVLACLALAPAQAAEPKVLRYAFGVAETTFDPARTDDLYSRIVGSHIFEALVDYDYLARPYRLVPGTAAALPEPNADFTVCFRFIEVTMDPGWRLSSTGGLRPHAWTNVRFSGPQVTQSGDCGDTAESAKS